MAIDAEFYTYLDSITTMPIQQNLVSVDKAKPYVWFQRSDQEDNLLLDGSNSITETNFDVEVVSNDIDEAETKADALKSSLHGYRGLLSLTYAQAIFVNSHSDDYIIRNADADQGLHVISFDVTVIT